MSDSNETNRLRMTVNGRDVDLPVRPTWTLLRVLRDALRLTGTKKGCEQGDCGACTVLLDGQAVNACLVLALQAQGKAVRTIEGLGTARDLHPLQQSFLDHGAVQCGFCTPGTLMSAAALLEDNPSPGLEEIRVGISGNLCRCTGYTKIIRAIQAAASEAP